MANSVYPSKKNLEVCRINRKVVKLISVPNMFYQCYHVSTELLI